MNGFECIETNEEVWNEDNRSVNFNFNHDIIHKADIKARNSFYSRFYNMYLIFCIIYIILLLIYKYK